MYTTNDLNELCRIFIQRGIQIEPSGIDHKHNEVLQDSPRSPIKLNICTPELRKEGHLTEEDMQKIVRMFWSYIQYHNLTVPALGGIPRVGEKLASMLQRYVHEQTGLHIPLVYAQKTQKKDGTREIGDIIPSNEYPSGDLWLIDDLVNWGFSKREAFARYTQAGYRVTNSLVAVDYNVGAARFLNTVGVTLHSLVLLDSILLIAEKEKSLDPEIITQTKLYLASSRKVNV